MNSHLDNYSHKRYNILTGEWVLVSPHRAKRPWQGQEEDTTQNKRPTYDPSCYLCPGNTRANGEQNPDYKDTYVFTNDFAALQNETPNFSIDDGLLKAESEKGICKVICFSSDHSKTLADMDKNAIEKVVSLWQKEYSELSKLDFINYVQIFENKGAVMGCSNPHPHGQIWAQSSIPNEVSKKDNQQKKYFNINKSSLLENYLKQELEKNERILFENENFVVIIPFWAIWPYETMIIPKKQQVNISQLTPKDRIDFAEAISKITSAYDKLFNCSFPYSSGIHQAPCNNQNNEYWHWHMSFYPPLLRSASVKKFMVGYEMFGMPQRDITAESAANSLKKLIF
ncbi:MULTISPECIES: UDP-glucose--hexose-1-phosphate uridylyltransferase [unclassified Tenacibaculum]|uniref:UDP-glucose--hexose-1-phosphate uridylyltransferase n=1 Tax=unclassified Tenacibaculum TaxID=2635139 RepID=UPI001F3ECA51|nr:MULTISPECIES: UDP-glucose--hexose-1-phosphate uridylyltransferase [unclassified Tenacibaculum]MCF2873630.1 UDP-glucose--hexose-1-phosphate uridylyltransferase [Tenacibaculum sp. Cn5-1]MCF2933786.1 UDP-glucose--hexose-1-phosphate uridylyltransferase [Tenacibaculum sp. Cn5-34]MCG7509632.1 UDP-glucose--hexose-1-phosphate uridylyltransferase [Tenacibaculum sp. Cn5-46]